MAQTVDAVSADGQEQRLDRERIVTSALNYMDRHGVEALTMRALGQDLGVEAMSIYRYVPGREDLLEAVVARLIANVHEVVVSADSGSWQQYLRDFAYEVRDVAVAHPAVFPLMATAHPATPWLRPPLRSVEVVEDFLSGCLRFGFRDEEAVQIYRSFTSFLLGNLLLESAVGWTPTTDHYAIDASIELPPLVARLHGPLADDRSETTFADNLGALLHQLESLVA